MSNNKKLEMHYDYDVTGYPCFYIHGFSGDEKRDTEQLDKYLELFKEAPAQRATIAGLEERVKYLENDLKHWTFEAFKQREVAVQTLIRKAIADKHPVTSSWEEGFVDGLRCAMRIVRQQMGEYPDQQAALGQGETT